MRKAFTLIELLVVIAIIAILAAILFPVFAQAKQSAKGAASISNNKQLITAAMLYMNDNDDRPPPVGIIGEEDSPFLLFGTPYKSWGWSMYPYITTGLIFQDPLWQPENGVDGARIDWVWAFRTQYGYAWTVHSPTLSGRGWEVKTTPASQIAEPVRTVFFLSKKSRRSTLDWTWVGSPIWMANLVAPPYCANSGYTNVEPNSICAPAVRWGANGYYQGEAPDEEDGGRTGGVAIRLRGKAIVTFSDGHAAALSASQLAAGTNWTRDINYQQIQITDKKEYMWDAE